MSWGCTPCGIGDFFYKNQKIMEPLTKMRKNFKKGYFGAFETLLDAYLTDSKGFAAGEAQIFEECLYQIKINGGEPEVNQVIIDKFSDELLAYYNQCEKIQNLLKNL